MAIRKIRVTNFKSFKDLEIELGNLNILIGANASGKSNFVQIFKFLRDIRSSGLDNAISMQGGVEYLRNINIGSSGVLSLEIVSDQRFDFAGVGKPIRIEIYETIYKFAIKFNEKGLGFNIVEDSLIYKCDFKSGIEKIGSGEIILSNINGKLDIGLNLPEGVPIKQDDMFLPFFKGQKLPPKTLLLETPPLFSSLIISLSLLEVVFSDISIYSIYDFGHGILREAVSMAAKAELEDNGRNLAIVLKNIVESEDAKRKFLNLVTYLLPFVKNLDVEKLADKFLLFKLQEIYSDKYLPAFLFSDGTVSMIALIIALYFGKKSLAIIEEPERGIHPHLISRVVNMMKDASRNKQIIVTTHNPEMVKYADPKDLLLISRDKEGFSSISRPSEKEEVKIFLENEIGIEELYVDNLLEI